MKHKRLKSILKLALWACVIALLVYVVIKLMEVPEVKETSVSEVTKEWAKGPPQEAHNATFTYSDSAMIKAILTAPHVIEKVDTNGQRNSRLFDQSFQITFYGDDGNPASVMTADTGEVYNEAEQGIAWGNVVIFSEEDSSTVKTEKLYWNNKLGRIWTNEKVNITTDQEIIYGDSMEADSGFAKFRIYKVYGTVQMEEGL